MLGLEGIWDLFVLGSNVVGTIPEWSLPVLLEHMRLALLVKHAGAGGWISISKIGRNLIVVISVQIHSGLHGSPPVVSGLVGSLHYSIHHSFALIINNIYSLFS